MVNQTQPAESAAPPVPSPDWTGTVQLVSADQDVLDVPSRAAEAALAVKRYLVDRDEDDDKTCQFPVEKVDTPTLKRVILYMERLCETTNKEKAGDALKAEDVQAWDKDYLKMPINDLFKLLLAGNYLDMPELLEFLCIDLAAQIHGKNPDQLRELFGVENDFSPEERKEIENEPKWDFD